MIDPATLITVATGVAGTVGGYFGGRKTNGTQTEAITAQASSIEALKARLDVQEATIATIPGMKDEIRILRELVTQRANVERVIEIVTEIKEKLDA